MRKMEKLRMSSCHHLTDLLLRMRTSVLNDLRRGSLNLTVVTSRPHMCTYFELVLFPEDARLVSREGRDELELADESPPGLVLTE